MVPVNKVYGHTVIEIEEISIGGLSNEDKVYERIIAREMEDYLHLDIICPDHNAPCIKCSSSRILWNEKPVHWMIARCIAYNITAVKVGPDIH